LSCNGGVKSEKEITEFSNSQSQKLDSVKIDSEQKVISKLDTIVTGSKIIYSENIPEKKYLELKKQCSSIQLKQDENHVKIDGKMCLIGKAGKKICFEDKKGGSETEEISYTYLGSLLNNYSIVRKSYYETSEILIIDKNNNKTVSAWDIPVMSGNQNYLMTFSNNVEYDILNNGIQVYDVSPAGVNKLFELEMKEGKPTEVCWIKENQLLMKVVFLNRNYDIDKEKTKYSILKF
jgi:hypothetical protein